MAGMDYGSLLQLAQKTSEMKQAKRSANEPPVNSSKENKNAELEKKKLLDANVAKFLAKREQEEKKKKLEADTRREGLLALRNQDSKARKRVKIMNKSAKSADRSVIQDATASSDYYVIEEPLCFMSQESLAQEEKFLEKLNKIPKEEIFSKKKLTVHSDLNTTKDRVKMALLLGDTLEKKEKREAKEKLKEHILKDKSKSDMKEEPVKEEVREEEKPKTQRQPRPPPMNYYELLKLAEKIQQEPVREEPKEKEPEMRPMTAKEKEQYLLEEASRKRKEEGWRARPQNSDKIRNTVPIQSSKSGSSSQIIKDDKMTKSIPRIPKISDKSVQENKRSECVERKQKSFKEENSGSSAKTSFYVTEEKTSTSKVSSKPVDNTIAAKHRSSDAKNLTERMKADFRKDSIEERNNQSVKMHGTKRDKELISSKSHSQYQEKHSSMSLDKKEAKYKPTSTKNVPSSIDEKPHSKKQTDNLKNVSYSDKSRMPSSAKSEEYKPNAHISSKKPSDVKPNQSDPFKQHLFSSKPSLTQSKQISSSDMKSKQYSSSIKSSSLVSSESKLNKNMANVKSKQLSPNPRSKQSPSDTKNQDLSVSSKSKVSSLSDGKSRNPQSDGKIRNLSLSDGKPRNLSPSDSKPRNFTSLDSKPRNFPPSDVKPRNLLTSDGKSRNLPPSDGKSRNFPPSDGKSRNLPPSDGKSRNLPPSDCKSRNLPPSVGKPRNLPPSDGKPRNLPPTDGKSRTLPPSDGKPRNFPPSDIKKTQGLNSSNGQLRKLPPNNGPKQFPPPDVRRKQFPPPDLKRKQFPPADVRRGPKPPPTKKRRVIDSDDEYDSEVADFIDDGDDDVEDYSKHIREIFGYDRSKYLGVDDDDECMESSFSQQLKEEFKSTKLGIMEDLEDIRREKQHEAMLKKRKKK